MRFALLVCLLCGVASAGTVTPPKGWIADPKTALSLSQQLSNVPHFGALTTIVTVEAYRTDGIALYVTRKQANVKPEQRDVAAWSEVIDLHHSPLRQKRVPSSSSWQELEVAGRLQAWLSWRDDTTVVEAQIVVVADAQRLVAVIGECVAAPDTKPAVRDACRAALATLDPSVPQDQRVALKPRAEVLPVEPPITAGSAQPGGSALEGPTMKDGGKATFQPIAVEPAKTEPDRRPIYLGAGLIVIAAVFWWNRKRREKLEAEYGDRAEKRSKRGDADADDLHSAADGDKEEKQ